MAEALAGLYGEVPVWAGPPAGAIRLSPLIPGAQAIEDLAEGALERLAILAPPAVLERRYALAQALRVLSPGGELLALAPKARGGARLAGELAAFGAEPAEEARRHHRICRLRRPSTCQGLDTAIAAGGLQLQPLMGLWTWPGVFSWDRLDPASALLMEHLGGLSGAGADLGCGIGVLARATLASDAVTSIVLVDLDRRAITAARRNLADDRATFRWADALALCGEQLGGLDFVIMNPPFHRDGREDRALGLAFIEAAARSLRRGGRLRLVANIALPWEARLFERFARVARLAEARGYRVWEAVK